MSFKNGFFFGENQTGCRIFSRTVGKGWGRPGCRQVLPVVVTAAVGVGSGLGERILVQ